MIPRSGVCVAAKLICKSKPPSGGRARVIARRLKMTDQKGTKMSKQKFQVGDDVRFNYTAAPRHQVPKGVRDELVGRTRRIVATYYDQKREREFYLLGARGRKQTYPYPFSSHQLSAAPGERRRGKPTV